MSPEHYYSDAPSSKSDERILEAVLRGQSLRLITDAGVFSKGRVDRGTRLLIESSPLPSGGTLLDLGCGYGPVGITFARLRPELHVAMVDVNRRAVELSTRNAILNQVQNVSVCIGDGLASVAEGRMFSGIYTNPPYRAGKQVVFGMISDAFNRLEPGGLIAAVGQTKQGIKSLGRHIESIFGNVQEVAKEGGYRVLVAFRH